MRLMVRLLRPLEVLLVVLVFATGSARAIDMAEAVTLVATPRLAGSVFERTVIIAAPLPSGMHVGFIVNYPTDLKLAALFPEEPSMLDVKSPVYIGGPVQPRALFAIARTPPADKGSLFQLMPGLVVAVEAVAVEHIIETSPNDARYFLGLLVWDEGELAEEIRNGAWEVQPAEIDMVFSTSPQNLWKTLYRGNGAEGVWVRSDESVHLAMIKGSGE